MASVRALIPVLLTGVLGPCLWMFASCDVKLPIPEGGRPDGSRAESAPAFTENRPNPAIPAQALILSGVSERCEVISYQNQPGAIVSTCIRGVSR